MSFAHSAASTLDPEDAFGGTAASASPHTMGLVLGLALAYWALGCASLALAGPPGYASPLYPAAGLALAAALSFGGAGLAGVALGALAVNVTMGMVNSTPLPTLVWAPLVMGLGAALQASVGAQLMRRHAGQPLTLVQGPDIARMALYGALLACTINPSVATLALFAADLVAPQQLLANWFVWWAGDAMGVLVATPLVLSFVGQPAEVWRPRRLTLGLPLATALLVLSAAIWAISHGERVHAHRAFERDADRLAASVQQQLDAPLHALQALQAAVRAAGRADAAVLRAAAPWWLADARGLHSMGVAQRVAARDVLTYEAAARAAGEDGFTVRHRDGGQALAHDGEALVVRHLEPARLGSAVLGWNWLSAAASRAAIEASRRSGDSAAGIGFGPGLVTGGDADVVLLQALPAAEGSTGGALFVAFKAGALLGGHGGVAGSTQRWCLLDTAPRAGAPRLLSGSAACAQASGAGESEPGDRRAGQPIAPAGAAVRKVRLADRGLELRVLPASAAGAAAIGLPWLMVLTACMAAAALGAWLLTVTGQSQLTQRAVEAATTDLRREIADRQQAEIGRAASMAQLRSILDNVPLGIAFFDPQDRLIDANARLHQMLGYGAESIRGGNVAELFDPADLPALRADMQRLFDGRLQVLRRKVSVRRRDKTTLTVRVACVALRSGAGRSGRVDRYVAVVEDLSDELRLQRAEAANRAKSEFVSRMGHELRTPLNAMLGFAQLLSQPQAQPLSEHHRAWAEQIQRAGWHLLDLVNDTLDLARIEAGNLRVQLEAVELAPLLESCVDLVAAAARPHGITITVELASLLPRVQADPTRLRQVVTNLLSNAVKYNREHGEVHLRARTDEGERVRLTVTDTGLGMTAAQMQHLFEPYNRLGREGSGVEGTGIGLTIARRLAELMGGELTAESTSGSGSTFSLTLRAAAGPPPEPLAADALSAPAYHQRTVLYIEDNPANVEVLRGMLLARPQVRLEVATLGLDGIEAVRRLRPDLILLDMQLPDINGLELLRHLMAGSPRIPVVVISADASAQRHDQALALGARDYVTKPLALGSFLQLLDEVLQETPTQQGSAELLL